jgi:hypothetical protein
MLNATDLPKPGTRLELLATTDPALQPGSTGIVRATSWHPAGNDSWAEIRVDWENTDQQIDLVVPPDQFRVLVDGEPID